MLEEEKEKLGVVDLDAKDPRVALSTFCPKLNVTPTGIGAALSFAVVADVESLPKENGAGAAEEEEIEEGGAAAAPCFFSSDPPPSVAAAPYCRSMLARCRS